METLRRGLLKNQICVGNKVSSGVVLRQNSKGHSSLCTKRHAAVLRETINKIDKVYKPIGYRISTPITPKTHPIFICE